MTDDAPPDDTIEALEALRARAMKVQEQEGQPAAEATALDPEAAGRLIHELQTHQIELQLQNEELRRVQVELAESHDRYVDLYDFAPIGYLTLDASGVVVEANATIAQMLGPLPAPLVGKKLSDHVGADHQDAYFITLRAMSRGGRQQLELQLRRATGTLFWARTDWLHVPSHQGGPARVRLSVSDQTNFKALQAQLMQADRLSSMGLLAAGIAHEINNPLTFVLFSLETLAERLSRTADGGKDRQQGLAELARSAADGTDRIRRIARRLKVFARPDRSGAGAAQLAPVLDSAVDMVRHELKFRARLVTDYGDLPGVQGNAGELCQVFLNLLINAAHATAEGDADNNEVRVTAQQEGDEVVVTVQDTGCGIAPEHLERIFEPFFTTKDVGSGSGLGLSICEKIIRDAGGTIGATSTPGAGSVFEVRLAIDRRPSKQPSRAPRSKPTAPVAPRRSRILVIDDEPGIALVLSRMLSDHDVVVTHSGLEARELIAGGEVFDVILCDLMMPRFSGMDLYAWLEAEHASLLDRVVFMTGAAFTPEAQELLETVPNPRLDKPFRRREVLPVVNEILEATRG